MELATADSTSPQRDEHGGSKRPAAFFDLDKTILAGSSTLAFGRPLYRAGMIDRSFLLRSAYARCVYRLSGADHAKMERMRRELTRMVDGWDADRLRSIVTDSVESSIAPMVYPEAVDLMDAHRAAGHDVLIVSSSGTDVLEPVAELLGVEPHDVIGTRMVVDATGRYTGEISFYSYGPTKAEAIEKLAADRGYDLPASYGYSDSITDQPMLEVVGHPTAVNPDRALRSVALHREWPILDFPRPRRATASANPVDPSGRSTTPTTVTDRRPRRPSGRARLAVAVVALAGMFTGAVIRVKRDAASRGARKVGPEER